MEKEEVQGEKGEPVTRGMERVSGREVSRQEEVRKYGDHQHNKRWAKPSPLAPEKRVSSPLLSFSAFPLLYRVLPRDYRRCPPLITRQEKIEFVISCVDTPCGDFHIEATKEGKKGGEGGRREEGSGACRAVTSGNERLHQWGRVEAGEEGCGRRLLEEL